VALTVTSLATSFWVGATLSDPDGLFKPSNINYGLFVGHIDGDRFVPGVNMDLSSKPCSQEINFTFLTSYFFFRTDTVLHLNI
jgi:hypothetical protein